MSVEWNGDALSVKIGQAALRGVARGINLVEAESVRLIMEGPKTGHVYRRRGVEHQASAPGEAPANDTGRLVNSRTVDLMAAELRGRLTYRTDYALALEVGTQSMESRSYARRALYSKRGEIEDAIKAEVAGALR